MIKVDISDAMKSLNRLEQALRHPAVFLRIISEKMARRARISFEREQSPEGHKWAPLSPRYAAWKTRRMPGRGILRASGQLVRSIHSGVTDRTAFISTANLPHAAIHQYGFVGGMTVKAHVRAGHMRRAAGGKRKTIAVRPHGVSAFRRWMAIPARPYLGFPLADQREATEDIAQEAEKIFGSEL